MKIRAPFVLQVDHNTDPTQVTGDDWYICGLGLKRLSLYGFKRKQIRWGYWRQRYLGSMLLSLPSQTYTWRRP
jgi:hypothetical protein